MVFDHPSHSDCHFERVTSEYQYHAPSRRSVRRKHRRVHSWLSEAERTLDRALRHQTLAVPFSPNVPSDIHILNDCRFINGKGWGEAVGRVLLVSLRLKGSRSQLDRVHCWEGLRALSYTILRGRDTSGAVSIIANSVRVQRSSVEGSWTSEG